MPERDPKTHDYTVRFWGHDFSVHRIDGDGTRIFCSGFGKGIKAGDFLILPQAGALKTTRYRAVDIRYERDPPDMWWATLEFAPRS